MKKEALLLVECLRAFRIGNMSARIIESLTADEWRRLYSLSAEHKLVPVVYEMLHAEPGFCGGDKSLATVWKRDTIMQAVSQTARTQKLLELTAALGAEGITYAVVKGAVCRELYQKPDLRSSGDEDIFISSDDSERCADVFRSRGLEMLMDKDADVIHWQESSTGLHIELHTALFTGSWSAVKELEPYFESALKDTVSVAVAQSSVKTLQPTVHFVFLVAHALKHFISGGFGIRTLSDILSFAEKYRDEINHDEVENILEKINGLVFFHELLSIGREHLSFAAEECGWEIADVPDYADMLEDILDAGIYGQTSMDRKHSAAISLRAVSENSKPSVVKALFPGASQLVGRYPALKKAKILLPACWAHRIACYALELLRGRGEGNSPAETLALGNKRTEMMVRYGILPKAKTEDR